MPDSDHKKCTFIKRDGVKCEAWAIKDSEHCYAHTRHDQDYVMSCKRDGDVAIGFYTVSGRYVPVERYYPGEFFSVPNRIHDRDIAPYIGGNGVAVFCCLCFHVKRRNKTGSTPLPKAYPQIDTISRETGISHRGVRRALKKLEECNIIYPVRMWRDKATGDNVQWPTNECEPTSTRYYIVSSEEWETPS